MFKPVIFAAVSTNRQATKDKLSIPDQLERCQQFIATRGWREAHAPLVVSGQSRERWVSLAEAEKHLPALATLLNLAEAGTINLVIVVDFNRFRGLLEQVRRTLGQYRVQVYSLNQPVEPLSPDDFADEYSNDTSAIVSTIAQITSYTQVADLRRKYQRFMPQRVDLLGLPYGYLPYGYAKPAIISSTDRVSRLVAVQVPEQCAVLLKLKEMYLKGASGVQLEAYLKQNNIPTIAGGEWKSFNILKMLTSPFYAGYVYRNKTRTKRDPRTGEKKLIYLPESEWILAPGKHPPLWSVDDYHRLNELRQRRKVKRANRSNSPKIFSLLLTCHACGRRLYVAYTSGGKHTIAYRCRESLRAGHVYIHEADALEQFEKVLREIVERVPVNTAPPPTTDRPSDTLEAALAANAQARARFQQAYGKGLLNDDDLADRLSELEAERARLTDDLRQSAYVLERDARNAARRSEAAILLADYDTLALMPPREANAKLSYLIESIVIDRETIAEVNLRDD